MTGVVGRLTALAVTVCALAACGAGAAAPQDSGIVGRVLIGPTCPVVQVGQDCADRPFRAAIRIHKAGQSNVVAVAHSGKEGRFRVALAPGRYVLVPVQPNGGAPPRAGPVAVRVRAHAWTKVKITYDSGIR
jgi:hypothetical protein